MYVAYLGIIRFDQRDSKEWDEKSGAKYVCLGLVGGGKRKADRIIGRVNSSMAIKMSASMHPAIAAPSIDRPGQLRC